MFTLMPQFIVICEPRTLNGGGEDSVQYTRGTPRVQYANIRKVLCQGLPHCLRLCVDPCMARHAQSLNSSLHACPQSSLDHAETGKKDKM